MNKAGTQTIETDRLILRQFRVEDAEDMYENWASDPEVTKFLTTTPVVKPALVATASIFSGVGIFLQPVKTHRSVAQ